MIATLIKSVGRRFFFENAGLFIFLFFVVFGFLRGEEHMAIARAISKNNELLLVIFILWSIYTITTPIFFLNKLNQTTYRFLWNLSLTSHLKRILALTINQGLINMPATLHALLVLKFTASNSHIGTCVILIYLFLAHALPVYIIQRRLSRGPEIKENPNLYELKIILKIKKPYWSWPLFDSLKTRPALWLISKPLAILILQGFLWVDQSENYPFAWISIGVLVTFSTNIPLLIQLKEFHKNHISILNNLPIPAQNHFAYISMTLLILISVESLILIYSWPTNHTLLELLSLLLFGLALNLLSYSVLMIHAFTQDRFFRLYFWLFIVMFITILSGLPIALIGVICLIVPAALYHSYYRLMIS